MATPAAATLNEREATLLAFANRILDAIQESRKPMGNAPEPEPQPVKLIVMKGSAA